MKVTPRDEQETIITWDKSTRTWHFYSDDPVHIRKWGDKVAGTREALDENGQKVLLEGNILGTVSVHGTRVVTDAQRAKQRERFMARMAKMKKG